MFGLEKTGNVNMLAKLPELEKLLKPGHYAMVTRDIANLIQGKNSKNKDSYFYGKRFIYRTLDNSKTFVVMVPPRVGTPYDRGNVRSDLWETYPTLRIISEIIEENSTDQFSRGTAALSSIAKANHAASIPKVLGEEFLSELVKSELSKT